MESLETKKSSVDLSYLAIAIVVLGITVAVGATILTNVRDVNSVNSVAYNVSNSASLGLGEFSNWYKIIVIVGIAAGILGLIFIVFRRPEEEPTKGGSY